ncbi:MAG: Re/Si-specific NAD(P)(+) transhydrogenase subunit alpha [Gemmatimonadetes bacterium]|nr:Re/Si-specific NAD(P)(+) transhydrogenase subunit alpha [Gemmatimonadota bacterium]
MNIAIPKETTDGERRVALVPDMAKRLTGKGITVRLEQGAGEQAGYPDDRYVEVGAEVVSDTASLWGGADVVLKIHMPGEPEGTDGGGGRHEVDMLREGAVLVGLLYPLTNGDAVKRMVRRKVTSFSLDQLPRITRAQSMDVLSSMSTVAGYKAVLLAAAAVGKFFPMLVTAAGTIAPSKALVLGAGVAGLQAIATARRLGAVVQAFDVRPAVKEQVESLGAKFLEIETVAEAETAGGYAKELSEEQSRRNREVIHGAAVRADVVITTALIPGKPAPLLIGGETVRDMKPGSVIVDLAAEAGGNCALTKAGEEVTAHGVTILGPVNLPSTMPHDASRMYSKNITTFLDLLLEEGNLKLDFEDEITSATCITHEGTIRHEGTRSVIEGGSGS